MEDAEKIILEELQAFCSDEITEQELQKVKNKFAANTTFGELNVMNKAMNLCYYEMLGDIEIINSEPERYQAIAMADIYSYAKELFDPKHSSTLIYKAKDDGQN